MPPPPWTRRTTQKQNKIPRTCPPSLHVTQLEGLISRLEALSSTPPTRDPRGGCFCLARNHPLSPYTPLCTSCGLILCALNKPHHLCPSSRCPEPNLLPSHEHRARLLADLRSQLAAELQKAEDRKLKQAEDKKKEAGAFPSLQSTQSAANTKPTPQTTHKVISITSSSQLKKKKMKQAITISSPSSSVPPSRTESPSLSAEDDGRLPEPSNSVIHALPPPSQMLKSRPWRNFTLSLDDDHDDHESVDIRYIPVST